MLFYSLFLTAGSADGEIGYGKSYDEDGETKQR